MKLSHGRLDSDWLSIQTLLFCFQYALLIKLKARHDSYTVTMKPSEKVLSFTRWTGQPMTVLKSMSAGLLDPGIIVAVLN